jgi:hypothetical protein
MALDDDPIVRATASHAIGNGAHLTEVGMEELLPAGHALRQGCTLDRGAVCAVHTDSQCAPIEDVPVVMGGECTPGGVLEGVSVGSELVQEGLETIAGRLQGIDLREGDAEERVEIVNAHRAEALLLRDVDMDVDMTTSAGTRRTRGSRSSGMGLELNPAVAQQVAVRYVCAVFGDEDVVKKLAESSLIAVGRPTPVDPILITPYAPNTVDLDNMCEQTDVGCRGEPVILLRLVEEGLEWALRRWTGVPYVRSGGNLRVNAGGHDDGGGMFADDAEEMRLRILLSRVREALLMSVHPSLVNVDIPLPC